MYIYIYYVHFLLKHSRNIPILIILLWFGTTPAIYYGLLILVNCFAYFYIIQSLRRRSNNFLKDVSFFCLYICSRNATPYIAGFWNGDGSRTKHWGICVRILISIIYVYSCLMQFSHRTDQQSSKKTWQNQWNNYKTSKVWECLTAIIAILILMQEPKSGTIHSTRSR